MVNKPITVDYEGWGRMEFFVDCLGTEIAVMVKPSSNKNSAKYMIFATNSKPYPIRVEFESEEMVCEAKKINALVVKLPLLMILREAPQGPKIPFYFFISTRIK